VRFGSGERSKHDLALEVCAVLARLLTRRGNPVGLMLHRGGQQGIDRMVPPAAAGGMCCACCTRWPMRRR